MSAISCKPKFFDADLTHSELLNLTGHSCGKDINELPVVRNFEVGNSLFAECLSIRLPKRRVPAAKLYPGHHDFAKLSIGDSDNLNILN